MSEFEAVDQAKRKFNALGFLGKFALWATGITVVLVVVGFVCYVIFKSACVTEVKNYQIAYQFDRWGENAGKVIVKVGEVSTGKIDPLTNKPVMKKVFMRGWIVTNPFKSNVYTLDMRPMQVQMNANSRILNAKLIQFNPEGIQMFLSWHGLDNYEGPGGSTSNTSNTFSNILLSYAYDGASYPFLTVLRELKQGDVQANPIDGEAQEVVIDKVPAQTEFQLGTDKKELK